MEGRIKMKIGNPIFDRLNSDNCPFYELCKACHPEPEMAKRRENCEVVKRKKCAVYWAFLDGYHGLDED